MVQVYLDEINLEFDLTLVKLGYQFILIRNKLITYNLSHLYLFIYFRFIHRYSPTNNVNYKMNSNN